MHECKNFRVPVGKPRDQKTFLQMLEEIKVQKKKAINMLFEEIEQEIIQKDRFVTEQLEKIREMNENFTTMLDYEQVLEKVAFILP